MNKKQKVVKWEEIGVKKLTIIAYRGRVNGGKKVSYEGKKEAKKKIKL